MNTKELATTIVFAALTVALNPGVVPATGVPAPYAPFLIYGLWEIPIVAAFILISPASGILISLLNAAVLFAFFPGPLPTGPFYNLIALFSMLIGLYIAQRFINHEGTHQQKVLKIAAASTILGIILRVTVMTAVNYLALPQAYPIGLGLEEMAVFAILPLTALFNGTVVLYTVPMGEFIANVVKSRLKLTSSNLTFS
jgi:riboflavin transporter FmnP